MFSEDISYASKHSERKIDTRIAGLEQVSLQSHAIKQTEIEILAICLS